MKSYEVIQKAVDEPGVKSVAAALKVSQALIYKWCEPPADSDDPDQSGAKNPLDRVREMYALTKDIRLVRWLCNEAGGFFVANPDPELRKSYDEAIFGETRSMVRDFRSCWRRLPIRLNPSRASSRKRRTRSAKNGKISKPVSSGL